MQRRIGDHPTNEPNSQRPQLSITNDLSPSRASHETRQACLERHFNEQIPIRLMRHTSLVLPSTQSQYKDEFRRDNQHRQRMNSWGGLHSLLNPNCPIHGRRALIEAYAMNKYLKMSQELHQALAEQERCKSERENSRWNRFIRKTWIHTRADCSLYLFSPKNKLRIRCLKITQKKWFDYIILCFIGVNCITLAMERPSIPPKSMERTFLHISGYVFTFIFTLEMTMKVIANGCYVGKGAYFEDGWNILDGILVIVSLVNLLVECLVSGGLFITKGTHNFSNL